MSTVTMPAQISSPDAQKFEQIYQEHAPLVNRTAWGVLLNREDAEDVLQTVFLKLLRSGFPPEFQKNPKAYLYRAAVNVSLDILRSRRRHPVHQLSDAERVEARSSANSSFDEEMHQWLCGAMAQLPMEYSEVLVLRHLKKMRTAEIAETLGVSRTAVAVRLFRARARLKKLLRISQRRQA
jgi:RNA polymerase sigma factor (sigma-70 family)